MYVQRYYYGHGADISDHKDYCRLWCDSTGVASQTSLRSPTWGDKSAKSNVCIRQVKHTVATLRTARQKAANTFSRNTRNYCFLGNPHHALLVFAKVSVMRNLCCFFACCLHNPHQWRARAAVLATLVLVRNLAKVFSPLLWPWKWRQHARPRSW